MKDGGRLAAAIEVLSDIETRRRPAQEALKDWGSSHRFAGSGDRVAIGNLVFDALRHKSSLAWMMGSDSARALALATYVAGWEQPVDALSVVIAGDRHAPEELSDDERRRLAAQSLEGAPDWVKADVPEWLWPEFSAVFGDEAVAEGQALAARAPIDLRVNRLKADRDKVLRRLAHLSPEPTPISPLGVRIRLKGGGARSPHVQAEEGFQKGWFELQDEASQIAVLLAGAESGQQVLDYCAGGGGKTLALAAEMDNRGQLYAYDADRLRLAPIYDRLRRAGARNIQVRDPKAGDLADLEGRMDLVFADVPCSGTGVWRRRPDTKWRLSAHALAERQEEQREALLAASRFVRPGGRLVYATCSLLAGENTGQLAAFLQDNPDFRAEDVAPRWREVFPQAPVEPRYAGQGFAMLSPRGTGTDGFFVSILTRKA